MPEYIDPDVDLHDPAQRDEIHPHEWLLLVVIAAGGVIGAEARYGLATAMPAAPGSFPWSTVLVNASGSLLLAVLMTWLRRLPRPPRLLRPFLGVGVLGGYTTFSTFAVDAERLLRVGRPLLALGYVVATLGGCGLAVLIGSLAAPRRRDAVTIGADRSAA